MFLHLCKRLIVVLCLALPAVADAEIFITNRGDDSVLVFDDDATGNSAPLRRIAGPATGFAGMNGIAADVQNGEIFVSVQTDTVLVFDIDAEGNAAPIRTLSGPSTEIDFPAGLAVDPIHNELFVVNLSANGVLVFDRSASGDTAPLRNIEGPATQIAQPTGIFVDLETDEIFTTNESSALPGVNVFDRSAEGNATPKRSILGPATTFRFALGLFENPMNRELSVVDLIQGSVLTFSEGASGNVAPIRVATASSLVGPAGISLTFDNEILINDLSGDALVGLELTASGLSTPTRLLAGPATGISTPVYVVSTQSPYPGNVLMPVIPVPMPSFWWLDLLCVVLVSLIVKSKSSRRHHAMGG